VIVSCRLDLLQLGVVELLADATGEQVSWGYSQPVQDAGASSYVVATLISGPSPSGSSTASGQAIHAPTSLVFTVDEAEEVRYAVELNGFSYVHDATALDDETTIAAALAALIEADTDGPASALSVADDLTVTPSSAGSIWSYWASDLISLAATLASTPTLVTSSRRACTLRIEAFGRGRSPRSGAWATINKVLAALQSPIASLGLAQYGVAVWAVGEPIDLSEVEGGYWESRVAVDVDVTILSTSAEPVDEIDSVTIDLSISTGTVTYTSEIN
jgi:hypothetical protein